MVDQTAAHRKTNPAFCADVRLFAVVDALVSGQAMFHRKPPPTYCTYIRPFACVRALVQGQVALLSESRSTILTAIWSVAGVYALVYGQLGWDPESLAAPRVAARVRLFANGSLHRVRCWRWRHRRFCQSCRSNMRQQELLAVGGHCLQRGNGLHWSRNWWRWQRRKLRIVGGCWDWWELVLITGPTKKPGR